MYVKLEFVGDLTITKAMDEWRQEVERLLNQGIKEAMEEFVSYGTVSIPGESD